MHQVRGHAVLLPGMPGNVVCNDLEEYGTNLGLAALQKFDWCLHKLICKTYKSHMACRPSPFHKSVI